MSNHPRPVLLGYIRADRLASVTEIHRVEAELATFAHREQFSLGTVYVEKGTPAGVFQALMDELARDDTAWGLVVPDLRHLTVVEHLVLRASDDGRTPVVVANHCPAPVTDPCRPRRRPVDQPGAPDPTDPRIRTTLRGSADV